MRVLSLDSKGLDEHTARLADLVLTDNPVCYDAIIGIARGGSIVCDNFCRHFPRECYDLRTDITMQRPTTKSKKGSVSHILKRLPVWMLDAMRIAESMILSAWRMIRNHTPSQKPSIPDSLKRKLLGKDAPQVLIIDDAIDSGNTMLSVINSLKSINPECTIRIAAITSTTSSPLVKADYCIYRNHTLIRFPWSNDYK